MTSVNLMTPSLSVFGKKKRHGTFAIREIRDAMVRFASTTLYGEYRLSGRIVSGVKGGGFGGNDFDRNIIGRHRRQRGSALVLSGFER